MTSRPLILVRRPSPALAKGELTHLDRVPVDPDLALEQWRGYVDAFRRAGWDVVEVEPADEHPDGVFIEDAVVVVESLSVLTSPGVAARRGEIPSTARALQALAEAGIRLEVAAITGTGTLDGGDVLQVGDVIYVGQGTRTNAEGVRQLAALVAPLGRRVMPLPVTKALHLKSTVTALPDGTVIGWPPLVDDEGAFEHFLPVPEEHGTAVVDLGSSADGRGRAVIMSADAPRTAELYAARGLEVVTVPITEFEKLEGCVTCLSVRIRSDGQTAARS